MPEEKQLKIISYIDYYILQMIKISSLSATSSYQQKYNKILIDKNIDSYNYLIECPIEEYTEPKNIISARNNIDLDMGTSLLFIAHLINHFRHYIFV